ncbi:MAG: GNAT family N-acetyltransferase [Acidobacteriota bacterium]
MATSVGATPAAETSAVATSAAGGPGASAKRWRLRPATDADRELLFCVYASTRMEELAVVPWSEREKEEFLRFQFEAQDRHYREHFPQTRFDVIEVAGKAAGRLYVDRRDDEIRLVDIALLPAFRGSGVGRALVTELLDEGANRGVVVRIHVERENRAMTLYRRLGFEKVEEQGVYDLMEWRPTADPEPTS